MKKFLIFLLLSFIFNNLSGGLIMQNIFHNSIRQICKQENTIISAHETEDNRANNLKIISEKNNSTSKINDTANSLNNTQQEKTYEYKVLETVWSAVYSSIFFYFIFIIYDLFLLFLINNLNHGQNGKRYLEYFEFFNIYKLKINQNKEKFLTKMFFIHILKLIISIFSLIIILISHCYPFISLLLFCDVLKSFIYFLFENINKSKLEYTIIIFYFILTIVASGSIEFIRLLSLINN